MSLSSLPSFPDVPFAAGVPAVLRNPQAAAGSLVNSVENTAIGAAQGAIGAIAGPVGAGIAAINGQISNIQNLASGALSSLPGSVSGLVSGAFGNLPDALAGDSPDVQNAAQQPMQWGVFNQDGTLALQPDSFKDFDYDQEWALPTYPMEQGAFQSYNKVQTPFASRINLTKGGSSADRAIFLNTIESIANSTNLYNISSPDVVYKNVSIKKVNYKRTAVNGVTLLTVELLFLEIRTAPSATFINTATPAATGAVNGGTVQAIPLTTGPNLTDGQPTSSAAFESGSSPPPAPADAAAASGSSSSVSNNGISTYVPPPAASSINSTETPAVSATSPQFPVAGTQAASGAPLGADGSPLTQDQVAAGTPYYTTDPTTGLLRETTIDSNGSSHVKLVPAPPKVQ